MFKTLSEPKTNLNLMTITSIECDLCKLWFHRQCCGLKSIPEAFTCELCQVSDTES